MVDLEESKALMKEVLGADLIALSPRRIHFEENIEAASVRIEVVLEAEGQEGTELKITGDGVGMVDAIFRGLTERFSGEYQSLTGIQVIDFSVKGHIDRNLEKKGFNSDAMGEVRLRVQNPKKKEFEFVAASRSIVSAALRATLDAVTYFMNSEKAFVITRKALDDAKQRNRADLTQEYARRLAALVENTSYSELLDAKN